MNRKNTQVKITIAPFELLTRIVKTPGIQSAILSSKKCGIVQRN
jgi:hypothetical protein